MKKNSLKLCFQYFWLHFQTCSYQNLMILEYANLGKETEIQQSQGFFFFFLILFLFLAVLGLHCCTQAFSSCSELGLPFIAVRGLLIAVASLIAEHRL